jgi:hypothetical protein
MCVSQLIATDVRRSAPSGPASNAAGAAQAQAWLDETGSESIATGMMGMMFPLYAIPVLSLAFVA